MFCNNIKSRFFVSISYYKEFKKIRKFKVFVVTSGYLSGKRYGKKIDLIKEKLNKVDLEIKNFPKKDTDFAITNSISDGITSFSNFFNNFSLIFYFCSLINMKC